MKKKNREFLVFTEAEDSSEELIKAKHTTRSKCMPEF